MERHGFHPGMEHHEHFREHEHRDHRDYARDRKERDMRRAADRKGPRGMQARRGQKPGLFGQKSGQHNLFAKNQPQRAGLFGHPGGKPMPGKGIVAKGNPSLKMQKKPITAR
jgi:hypothetical protein